MNNDLMAMTTMMRAKMRIVMTMSLNLRANASHVRPLKGKRMLAQRGVQQQRQHCQVWSCLTVANGSKPPGNGAIAVRGARSGPNGNFVGFTVGVTNLSKAMGFAGLTVAEVDVSMQVGVERVLKAQPCFALPTAGASDASMQLGVERVPEVQVLIVRLTVAESDVSMQVGVETVLYLQLLIAFLTAEASDVSMQVGVETVLYLQLLIAFLTAEAIDVSMQVGVKRVPNGQVLIVFLTAGATHVSMQVVVKGML
jgi:hypothetical protein